MEKSQFHKARSRTPFADNAKDNPLDQLRLQICLAHGITDEQDALTVDETMFRQLLKNKLQAADYESALLQLDSLAPTDPDIIEITVKNQQRLKRFLPNYGHKNK